MMTMMMTSKTMISSSKPPTKDWDCHLMESSMVSVAGTGQEREHGRSRQGNASVRQFKIYSNTLWKISCSGEVPETVDAVKLIRDQDEVIVRVVNSAEKKNKQVLGVCLAGVLWSSGQININIRFPIHLNRR